MLTNFQLWVLLYWHYLDELQRVLEAWRNGSKEIQVCIERKYGREVIENALDDHTNIFCLPLEHLKEVRLQWESGDPETRKDLERRYGKKNLIKACEENFSEEWISRYSKKCPKCNANIEVRGLLLLDILTDWRKRFENHSFFNWNTKVDYMVEFACHQRVIGMLVWRTTWHRIKHNIQVGPVVCICISI